jgi:hypothetical protein
VCEVYLSSEVKVETVIALSEGRLVKRATEYYFISHSRILSSVLEAWSELEIKYCHDALGNMTSSQQMLLHESWSTQNDVLKSNLISTEWYQHSSPPHRHHSHILHTLHHTLTNPSTHPIIHHQWAWHKSGILQTHCAEWRLIHVSGPPLPSREGYQGEVS